MKTLLFVGGVLLAGCNGCQPPTPAPVPPPSPAAVHIFVELVEAGCMAPDTPGGAAAIDGLASLDAAPWLTCLYNGGTVQSCAAPCGL